MISPWSLNGGLSARRMLLRSGLALAITVLGVPVPVRADEGLEEVVVTAQRRAQSVQDVPIAITAFSADAIANLGVKSSGDLAQLTPNLTWVPSGAVGSAVGIRGVVDTVTTTNQVGSVAIVVDEVSLNSPVLNTFPVFDLARIEVLRGPQVALYGRSTTGGAINFVTNRAEAGSPATGKATLSIGNFNDVNFEGAIGAPLGDKAGVRLAILSDKRNGIYGDPTLGRDVGGTDQRAARLSFEAKPLQDFSIFANFFYGRDRSDGPYFKGVGMRNADGTACAPSSSNPGGPCVDGSGFQNTSGFNQLFTDIQAIHNVDVRGGLVNLKWRFNDMSLTSITSVYKNLLQQMEDPDGGPASLNELHIDDDTRQTAEELRLASEHDAASPIHWSVGAYFQKETQDGLIAQLTRTVQIQPQPFPPPTWFPPIPQFRSMRYGQDDRIGAGYFQIDWKFAQDLELTVGGRYSSEHKYGQASTLRALRAYWLAEAPPIGTFIDRNLAATLANPNPAITSATPTPFDKTWNNTGGKIGLNWRPEAGHLYYANISRGFKGGTFNFVPAVDLTGLISATSAATFQAGVEPEKLTTYELGTKLDFLNRTVRLNLAAFWNDYTNQQTVVFQDGGLALINAASSTAKGLEAELEWAPADSWLVSAGLGLLDGKYNKFVLPQGGGDLSGGKLVDASDVNANGLVQKSWEVSGGKLSAQVSFKYISAYYPVAEFVEPAGYPNVAGPFTSYDVRDRIDAHTIVDARVAYAFGVKRGPELSLWAHNLSDARYCTTTGELPWGMGQCAPSAPRTYGVQFTAGF